MCTVFSGHCPATDDVSLLYFRRCWGLPSVWCKESSALSQLPVYRHLTVSPRCLRHADAHNACKPLEQFSIHDAWLHLPSRSHRVLPTMAYHTGDYHRGAAVATQPKQPHAYQHVLPFYAQLVSGHNKAHTNSCTATAQRSEAAAHAAVCLQTRQPHILWQTLRDVFAAHARGTLDLQCSTGSRAVCMASAHALQQCIDDLLELSAHGRPHHFHRLR